MLPGLLGIMNWPIDLDMIYILWVIANYLYGYLLLVVNHTHITPYMGLPKMVGTPKSSIFVWIFPLSTNYFGIQSSILFRIFQCKSSILGRPPLMETPLILLLKSSSGWWVVSIFVLIIFHRLGMSSSQLTNSIIFSERVGQPLNGLV